jgi:thiamine biosynthesis lipoprotein
MSWRWAAATAAGTPWRVGIQHPRPQAVGGAPLATLELRDGEAIGTSGDYHRYFEIGGRRYCHLLDPRTGFPAKARRR